MTNWYECAAGCVPIELAQYTLNKQFELFTLETKIINKIRVICLMYYRSKMSTVWCWWFSLNDGHSMCFIIISGQPHCEIHINKKFASVTEWKKKWTSMRCLLYIFNTFQYIIQSIWLISNKWPSQRKCTSSILSFEWWLAHSLSRQRTHCCQKNENTRITISIERKFHVFAAE